jgi:hypothetical protein
MYKGIGFMPLSFTRQYGERSSGFRGVGDTDSGIVDGTRPASDGFPLDPTDVYDLHAMQPLTFDRIINIGKSITLAASASRSTVAAFKMPSAYQGIIRFFANSVGNASDYSSVTWSLRVNGSDVSGFSNFVGLLSPGLFVPLPIRLDLAPGDRVTVVASNSSTASILQVAARMYGWAWAMNVRG